MFGLRESAVLICEMVISVELTLAATYRARQISNGATPQVEANKDKPTVIALREIASGKVGMEVLNRGQG